MFVLVSPTAAVCAYTNRDRAITLAREMGVNLLDANQDPPVLVNLNGMVAPVEDDDNAESDTYNAYCVKCKTRRDFAGEVVMTSNNRRMARGNCGTCGKGINVFLPSIKA